MNESISDAVANLGQPVEIIKIFTGFQKHLYQQSSTRSVRQAHI